MFAEITFTEYARFFLVMFVIAMLAMLSPDRRGRPLFASTAIFEFFTSLGAPKKRTIFFKSVFAVLAKLAQAGGAAYAGEVASAFRTLNLSEKEYEEMTIYFNSVFYNDKKSLNDYLILFMKTFSEDMTSRLLFIRVLFSLSAAGKFFAPQKEDILKAMAAAMGISPTQYNVMREEFFPSDHSWRAGHRSHSGHHYHDWYKQQSIHQSDLYRNPTRKYYDLLGLSSDCSDDELKQMHRELVFENHPDRLLSRGFPPQAIQLAKERFLQIQDAYEQICKLRGIK